MNRIHLPLLLAAVAFCVSCTRNKSTSPASVPADSSVTQNPYVDTTAHDDFERHINDTIPLGDLNGDHKGDTAIIMSHAPQSANDSDYVTITFNNGMPNLIHGNAFHGLLANVGDLDGDGTCEVLYYPDWYQSNWAGIFIYALYNEKWQMIGQGTIRRDILAEAGDPIKFLQSRVKKVDNRHFRITDHEMNDEGDIADKKRTVEIEF